MSFIKAENALKRSEELVAVGRPVEALETLRTALFTRRFKFAWTEALEEIVKSYVRMSFELREVRNLKEGFLQYRSAGHVSSFERCVRYLLEFAQSRVSVRSAILPPGAEESAPVHDLEEAERPEALLLRAFSAEDASPAALGKFSALRDLWETFRLALDLTRAHAPFEELYHEIARRACQFCLQNRRASEFRRLCELLRLHYSYLPRQAASSPATAGAGASSSSGPQVVSGSSAETILKQLETRMVQLGVALELSLFSVAFAVAEDMQTLMSRRIARPGPVFLKQYFARLAALFLHTRSATFHAFALLRHAVLARQLAAGEHQHSLDADRVVLAALAALAEGEHHGAGASTGTGAGAVAAGDAATELQGEKNAKLATLVSAGGAVPSTEQIFTELVTRGLVNLASEPVQHAFHNLIESDGREVHDSLTQAVTAGSLAPELLLQYGSQIQKAVFVKGVVEAARVYSRMPLVAFKEELCENLVAFSEAEKILLALKKAHVVDVKIDYFTDGGVVHFTKIAGARVKDFSGLLLLATGTGTATASGTAEGSLLATDRQRIRELRERIGRRASELEAEKTEKEAQRQQSLKEQDERDREMLRKLKEEEQRRKENELRDKLRMARELERAKDLDERLKDEKLRKEFQSAGDWKTLATVVKEMEKQLDLKIKKEIALKLQQRKSEFKKVNLTAKVLRYEEAKRVATVYKPEVAAKDKAFFDAIRQKQIEEHNRALALKQEAASLLTPARDVLFKFRAEKLVDRKDKLQSKIAQARDAHVAKQAREAIELVFARYASQTAEEDDEEYYERMATGGQPTLQRVDSADVNGGDILRVDSVQSRDDFKRH